MYQFFTSFFFYLNIVILIWTYTVKNLFILLQKRPIIIFFACNLNPYDKIKKRV